MLRLRPRRHSSEASKSHTGAGGAEAEADGAPQPSTLALQRLIARHLLDSATSIPTDNARIRAQVFTPPLTTLVPAYQCRLLDAFLRERWSLGYDLAAVACALAGKLPQCCPCPETNASARSDLHFTVAQLARPECAPAFEEALRAAGGASLEAALNELGDGDGAALEIGEFETRGGTRLMVLGFDRVQLARHTRTWPLACLPTCERWHSVYAGAACTQHGPAEQVKRSTVLGAV